MKDYLRVKTTDTSIMTIMTFKKMVEILPKDNFTRVHRSYIVPLSKIESIERSRIKIGDQLIPLGDLYKDDFYKLLKDMGVSL
jgi:DNA-binding LytR/AlgR family response regulator